MSLRLALRAEWELGPDGVVDETRWRDDAWRAEFLCQRARIGLSHVHDAPEAAGKRVIKFAQRKLG
jgi:hypothetical protein